ncbi:M48 family metallopeptidase [Nocardiopsis sp. CNT312]|uniref:M48 metallopeptidase family protein n=1 Tax=Nocardiopsis sp. CNT312 TaxID=1137268 RepID=UPI000491DC79|nr:M48 family metallopeptidase [Nocardiopsis sp. CNT312]
MPSNTKVEVRRSPRRRRTVSAYRDGDTTVVLMPASFSRAEEKRWVGRMLQRLEAREGRRHSGDHDLHERALELARQYLDGTELPESVRWVDNQNARWGSCTPETRTIRISRRLISMPSWVVDYVLVHELAHLFHAHHGREFWDLVRRYPKAERARGYLEGFSAASRLEACDQAGDTDAPGDATEIEALEEA